MRGELEWSSSAEPEDVAAQNRHFLVPGVGQTIPVGSASRCRGAVAPQSPAEFACSWLIAGKLPKVHLHSISGGQFVGTLCNKEKIQGFVLGRGKGLRGIKDCGAPLCGQCRRALTPAQKDVVNFMLQ